MESPRILIAGAGAIGSVVGGLLHLAGHRVTMLGREAHADAIRSRGLRITGKLGAHFISGLEIVSDSGVLEGRFDLILSTVKTYDSDAIAEDLRERLDDHGVIVSIQNGLVNIETYAHRFGPKRVLGARVIFGAETVEPGCVHVTVTSDPLAIGPAPAFHREDSAALQARAIEITAMIDSAGVPCVAVADVMPVIWTKLIFNAALNPTGALLGMSYGELAADESVRSIMDRAIDEAFAVARAEKVAVAFKDPNAFRESFYGRLIPATFKHRPTMLFDLRRRARTEIDALNGAIVRLATAHGLDAPINRALTAMIQAAERARRREMEASA
jgi:2-dehydropantoate 2-reductase